MSRDRMLSMSVIVVVDVLVLAFLGWTWFFVLNGLFIGAMGLLCLQQKRRQRSSSPT